MVSPDNEEFCAVCEYPSSRLELAEVRLLSVATAAALSNAAVAEPAILGGPVVVALFTTTVLHVLLHCDPRVVAPVAGLVESTSVNRFGRTGAGID